ncbi:MAG TPA: prepilin-type N-terminal cleavage/methylation domain-containing protein [Thermoanaerobaculia bacterium]
MRRKGREGFTLIELLVVVAIIGIVASIAIANYMGAVTRARQKRTMADIRNIATAWEGRNAEKGSYAPGFTYPATAVTYDDVEGALSPDYMKNVPKVDGWGRPYEFAFEGSVYAIRSAGRDGLFEGADYEPAATSSPDCDLVYSNGRFVTWPADMQSN